MFLVISDREKSLSAEAAKAEFDKAVEYLSSKSSLAKDILRDLNLSGKTIQIIVQSSGGANSWNPSKQYSGGVVKWWPKRPKIAGQRSAALGLMHELGHALQFCLDPAWVKGVIKGGRRGRALSPDAATKLDEPVIDAIECTVANEINASLGGGDATQLEPIREGKNYAK